MLTAVSNWRGLTLATAIVLAVASFAFAQRNGAAGAPIAKVMEFTHQEVQAALLVQTLNDLGKQQWEVFQVVPVWRITQQNGETELLPKSYQIFGRRPVEAK